MQEKKNYVNNLALNVWFGLKTSFLVSKKYFAAKLLILLSTTLMPLISLWLWRDILNCFLSGQTRNRLLFSLGAYLAVRLGIHLFMRFDRYVSMRYEDEFTFYIEKIMMKKTAYLDLKFFDSADMGDRIRYVRNNFGTMKEVAWILFSLVSELINVISAFVIITYYNSYIGILTALLLLPFLIYHNRYLRAKAVREKEQVRDNRKIDYFHEIFFDNNAQFEMKLNCTGEYFIGQHKSLWDRLYEININADKRYSRKEIAFGMVGSISEIITLLISAKNVMLKQIGVGDLQYHVSIVVRLRTEITQFMTDINRFLLNNTRLTDLREYFRMEPDIEKSGERIPSGSPRIEFSHVCFHYPNSQDDILKDCSFVIQPHEKIGLVGKNGSGKTTIIKLLFRFYDPQEGAIMLDGIDIKEYDVYALRKIFGVLFQDYVTYSLPLREIIGLSDFENRWDDEALSEACRTSGFMPVIQDWKDGFDSVLGRFYADNGKDLSGGQWQLAGLSRAYFKKSEFMILDEPSASLDPISEDRIFKQLYSLSKGKGAVTISHRLSNTILADTILVIDKGHVAEQGSHDDLLNYGGIYAHLFRRQADQYN